MGHLRQLGRGLTKPCSGSRPPRRLLVSWPCSAVRAAELGRSATEVKAMSRRWFRSRWLWLAVCVVVGSVVVTILSVQALRIGFAIAEAMSSGARQALEEAGFDGPSAEAP